MSLLSELQFTQLENITLKEQLLQAKSKIKDLEKRVREFEVFDYFPSEEDVKKQSEEISPDNLVQQAFCVGSLWTKVKIMKNAKEKN